MIPKSHSMHPLLSAGGLSLQPNFQKGGGVCPVRLPQIVQVQAKISTVRAVFPDYLSVSYDYVIWY